MGLFSSKKKTNYTCYATRLYGDSPTILKQTVSSSIVQNRNIANDLITNIANGSLFRVNQFYNYAKNGGHPWGLPEGSVTSMVPSTKDKVEAVLREQVVQEPLRVNFVTIDKGEDGEYVYEVEYYLLDSKGNITGAPVLWTYNEGTGLYPLLTIDSVPQESPYYPVTPIRIDNVNIGEKPAEGQDAPEYRGALLRACTYMNLNLDDIYDGVNEQANQEGQDNPPEDMFIILGVSVSSDSDLSKEYLFRYFEKMYGESYVTQDTHEDWASNDQGNQRVPSNVVTISDDRFTTELEWDYISRKVKDGVIGKKGTYATEYSPNSGVVEQSTYYWATSGLLVQYQISDTQYLEYVVSGLVYRNLVVGRKWVSKSLTDAFEDPDGSEDGECFIIPLRKDVLKGMGNIRGTDLMPDCVRLLTNDKYSYRVKWYQSGIFQLIVVVIAVVVSIYSAPAGVAIFSAAMAGIVIQNLIIQLVLMPLVLRALEDLLGPELLLLVAVLVTAAGGMGALSSGIAVTPVTVASAAVQLSNGITDIKTQRILEDMVEVSKEIEEIQDDIAALSQEEYEDSFNVATVTSMISADPYNMMEPSGYVRRFQMEHLEPTLINDRVDNFVSISQFVDKPYNTIRLGV